MSVKAITWAFEQQVSGNEKVVLLSLADYSNERGECWPSINRLVERACVSESTVHRVLVALAAKGLIQKEAQADNGGRSTVNKYRLCISECQRVSADVSVYQRGQGEGVNLTPPGVTSDRGEGVTHDTGEGVNCDTPLKRTTIRNRHKEPSCISADAEFAEFWAAYPKRKNNPKQPAIAKYVYARQRLQVPHETIMAGVKAYAASREGQDPTYTAQAKTWLNERRWEDEYDAPAPAPEPTAAVSDDTMDGIIARYPGTVSDRDAAKKVLAVELKSEPLERITEALEKFSLLAKAAKSEGRMLNIPILETWLRFRWRDMDAYEFCYRGATMKKSVRPVRARAA